MIHPPCPPFDLSILLLMFLLPMVLPFQSTTEALLSLYLFMFHLLLMFLNFSISSFVVSDCWLVAGSVSTFDTCSIMDCCTEALYGSSPRTRFLAGPLGAWLASPSLLYHCHQSFHFSCCTKWLLLAMASSSWSVVWLSFLVCCDLLGSISRNLSLDCWGCRVRKQIQLPYPHSEYVSQSPFDLVQSDVWAWLLPFKHCNIIL